MRSNQPKLFSVARLLTWVGLLRVSIGPPIIVIVFGSFASPSVDMIDTAASTGTVGWHTEIRCTSGPRCRMNSIT